MLSLFFCLNYTCSVIYLFFKTFLGFIIDIQCCISFRWTLVNQLYIYILLLFSCSVVFDSLPPHGLQHYSLPCPSLSSGVFSDSCLLSWWRHPTISSSVAHFFCPHAFPAFRVFSNKQALCNRWSKYWSFSISPSNEYSELIYFRSDWFDLLAVQGTLKSLLLEKINSLALSLLYGPTFTPIHDYWKIWLWLYRPLSAKWCLCFLTC